MSYQTLDVTVDTRGVVTVALNRPEKKNALSAQMLAEITQVADTLGHDEATRVVVLKGAGSVFCAGGDLTWMQEQINADREKRMREARKLAHMLRALNEMRAPLIGQIHGGAFGGGVGMACVCDMAIASDTAKFGLTETRLGLIPATIGPYVIARLGEGVARRIFMSSRIFESAEALEFGIVGKVVPQEDLAEAVDAEVDGYLRVAPGAVGRAKALARRLGPVINDAVIEMSVQALADAWDAPEAAEGIDAFLTKRKAKWRA